MTPTNSSLSPDLSTVRPWATLPFSLIMKVCPFSLSFPITCPIVVALSNFMVECFCPLYETATSITKYQTPLARLNGRFRMKMLVICSGNFKLCWHGPIKATAKENAFFLFRQFQRVFIPGLALIYSFCQTDVGGCSPEWSTEPHYLFARFPVAKG